MSALIDRYLDLDLSPAVHRIGEATVLQDVKHPADAFLGIVLNMAHIGMNDIQTEQANCLAQFLRAGCVGGDLRCQIGHVLIYVAARIPAGTEQRSGLRLLKSTFLDQQKIVDQHAFLFDVAAVGRSGTGRLAADIRMVPARGDGEYDVFASLVEYRRDNRYVR